LSGRNNAASGSKLPYGWFVTARSVVPTAVLPCVFRGRIVGQVCNLPASDWQTKEALTNLPYDLHSHPEIAVNQFSFEYTE
jgi:hypothetical protein